MEKIKEAGIIEIKKDLHQEIKLMYLQLRNLNSIAAALLIVTLLIVLILSLTMLNKMFGGSSYSHYLLSLSTGAFILVNTINIMLFTSGISNFNYSRPDHFNFNEIKDLNEKEYLGNYNEAIISRVGQKREEMSKMLEKKAKKIKIGCYLTGGSVSLYAFVITIIYFF